MGTVKDSQRAAASAMTRALGIDGLTILDVSIELQATDIPVVTVKIIPSREQLAAFGQLLHAELLAS